MAECVYLFCVDCREKIWIGQHRNNEPKTAYVYTSSDHIAALTNFFLCHTGHSLTVGGDALDDELDPDDDWSEQCQAAR